MTLPGRADSISEKQQNHISQKKGMFQEVGSYQQWQIFSVSLFIPTKKTFSEENVSAYQLSFIDSSLYPSILTNFWLTPFCLSLNSYPNPILIRWACFLPAQLWFHLSISTLLFSLATNLTSGDWEKEYQSYQCRFPWKNLLLSNFKRCLFILCLPTWSDLSKKSCLIPKPFLDSIFLVVFLLPNF